MSRVFVVQKQMKWDEAKGDLVPKFDLSPAAEYGEIIYLLTPKAGPFNTDPLVSELREKLWDFCDSDYLLLIGNPLLMSICLAIASDYNDGRVNALQWSGKDNRYIIVSVNL